MKPGMDLFGSANTTPNPRIPKDSPDLAFLMSFVTAVGGVGAYTMRRSVPGLIAGVGVSTLFLVGGYQIITDEGRVRGQTKSHETSHQLCLIGSLMFTGAMSYRAASNPYSGPGGLMLAALGGIIALYHGDKMIEWRQYEQHRVAAAEKLLKSYQRLSSTSEDGQQQEQQRQVQQHQIQENKESSLPLREAELDIGRIGASSKMVDALPLYKLVPLLIYLAFFAQLGVITRVFLDEFFVLGCNGGWGPCLAGSLYFAAAPSNFLGSLIIGIAATSSTLGLSNDKPLAILPAQHTWQQNFELQVGIRTGYCGVVTTLSSWVVELSSRAMVNNAWVECFSGLFFGLFLAIMGYIMGMHFVLYIDRWYLSEDVLKLQERYKSEEITAYRYGGVEVERLSPQQAALIDAEPDIPRLFSTTTPTPPPASQIVVTLASNAAGTTITPTAVVPPDDHDMPITSITRLEEGEGREPRNGPYNNNGAEEQPQKQQQQTVLSKQTATQKLFDTYCHCKTHIVVTVALLVSTALLAMGTALETNHMWLREAWLASLIAPTGAILRWYLSRYNYTLHNTWGWFPLGTFIANMTGTAIMFGLQCLIRRDVLDYWGLVVVLSVQQGFCGALTTVSTFVSEIVKFAEVFPDSGHAYSYPVMTLLGGFVLGLAIFGWAAWVPL